MTDRVLILSLGGCAVFGTLLFLELTSAQNNQPDVVSAPARVEAPLARPLQRPRIDDLVATSLGRPLFSETRKPPEQAIADRPVDEGLANLRLTGIVIDSGRRLAIFAVAGAKPLVRSEGEAVDEMRLDSIGPRQVVLSGPTGITTLKPKTDPNIVRPVTAAQPGAPPGRPVAPGRPLLARPPPAHPVRVPTVAPDAAAGPAPPRP